MPGTLAGVDFGGNRDTKRNTVNTTRPLVMTLLFLLSLQISASALTVKTTVLKAPRSNQRIFLYHDVHTVRPDKSAAQVDAFEKNIQDSSPFIILESSKDPEASTPFMAFHDERATALAAVLSNGVTPSNGNPFCEYCTQAICDACSHQLDVLELEGKNTATGTTLNLLGSALDIETNVLYVDKTSEEQLRWSELYSIGMTILCQNLGADSDAIEQVAPSITIGDHLSKTKTFFKNILQSCRRTRALVPQPMTRKLSEFVENAELVAANQLWVVEAMHAFIKGNGWLKRDTREFITDRATYSLKMWSALCSRQHTDALYGRPINELDPKDRTKMAAEMVRGHLIGSVSIHSYDMIDTLKGMSFQVDLDTFNTVLEKKNTDISVVAGWQHTESLRELLKEMGYTTLFDSAARCNGKAYFTHQQFFHHASGKNKAKVRYALEGLHPIPEDQFELMTLGNDEIVKRHEVLSSQETTSERVQRILTSFGASMRNRMKRFFARLKW